MNSELKSQGYRAVFWDLFGKLARNGTGFVVTVILARLLEPSEFGLVAMVMVIIGIAFIFSDVGLGSALIQRRRILPIHYSSVFYFNIFIGSILTIIIFLASPWIGEFYKNEAIIPLAKAMSLLFLINSFSSVQNNKLRKELNYAALAKANVGAAVSSGSIGIALALCGAGVWSLAMQALSRGIIYNILIWNASKWIPNLTFSIKALKQLWGFGFRMFLSGLLEIIYSRMDIIIIGKLFSPATLGFFDQAKRLNELIVQYTSGSIMAVLFPVLSKIQHDLSKFQKVSIKALSILSFLVFYTIGALYVVSHDLIILLLTEKWLPSIAYFKIILLGAFAYPLSALLVNILSSRGNSKKFLELEIYKKIIQTINFYIGFLYGINGYLYGLVVVAFLSIGLNIWFASREILLPFTVFIFPILLQMVIAIFSSFFTFYILDSLDLSGIIAIIINGLLYSILFLLINWSIKTPSVEYITIEISSFIKKRQ
ncbi:lipopolysaccharide biosynthesis protein [Hydrogenimonas sp.]